MAAAAAAGTRHGRMRRAERARQSFLRKKQQRRQKASQAFYNLSSDGEYLEEEQLEEFLEQAYSLRKEELDGDAVQMVKDEINKKQAENSSSSHRGRYQALALLDASEKYSEYMRNIQKVNKIFQKFDKNKDGCLSRKELRKALEDHERGESRSVKGIHIRLMVSDDDLSFILEQADASHEGSINRAELLPAIAAWEEIAALHLEEKAQRMKCVIM